MFGYKVEIDQYCEHSEHSGEQFGDWRASYTNSIKNLVQKTDEYPDITSSLDIAPGTQALVVWAVWSSGDSFGRNSGGHSEAFGIFTDLGSAVQLREALYAHTDNNKSTELTTSDGQKFTLGYMPWFGYFESLDSVSVDVVTVF